MSSEQPTNDSGAEKKPGSFYGIPNRDYGMRMATMPPENDGPIWMVNLMKYHEVAQYDEKHATEATDATGRPVSGREADERYAPIEILHDIGAQVVFAGDVEQQLFGEPKWDRIGVVRYATRRSFVEMQSRPDFQAKHVHKRAGMSQTIVMGCLPKEIAELATLAPKMPDWSEVAHPPTAEDGPVVVLHVIKYAEGAREKMSAYHEDAAVTAFPHGARVAGWFDVEDTIVGDGRSWDEVRFNLFPSLAAFRAVLMDPARIASQQANRNPAIADTYAIVIRPRINRLDVR